MSVGDGASDDDEAFAIVGGLGEYYCLACDGADGGVACGGEAGVRAEGLSVGDWAGVLVEWVCVYLVLSGEWEY